MSNSSTEDFFDDLGGGTGAPSIKLSAVNDGVIGTIVDQFKTEAKVFGSDDFKRDKKTGEVIKQLVVVLDTPLRNWDRVAKIPDVDKDDKSKGKKPASEDDGRRALYIEPWTNLHAAVGKARQEVQGGPKGLATGATLGVKVVELKDTGKGNPLKIFEAKYTAPSPSSDIFTEEKTAGGSGDASTPAPSTPAAAEPQRDPWASEQTSAEPPF